jgi:hypothetical protein
MFIFAKRNTKQVLKMQLLTPIQQKRAERNKKIVKVFQDMRRRYPAAKDGRIFAVMAEQQVEGITSVAGIRKVLVGCGAVPARRTTA